MFKHTGVRRTHIHNVRLAGLLCLTAGMVNAEGFLGFSVLTTNVTGHAALFAEKVSMEDWTTSGVVAWWMSMFLAGAFISGILLEVMGKHQRYSYLTPLMLELSILSAVAIFGSYHIQYPAYRQVFSGMLLFAMGMQNALVSVVSGSVVRTTHLTGTFTDLGIELARLLTGTKSVKSSLHSKISLKLIIIGSFITGALTGAWIFRAIHFRSFFAPAFVLVFAMLYDIFRINIKRYYRKLKRSADIPKQEG